VRVVALVGDLMDRSKVTAAIPGAEFARDVAACAGADVVVVDLSRFADAVAGARAVAREARIVAFGPHVDDEAFARARADGADAAVARSVFFRDPGALVTRK
jgi:hypothetical protein